MLLLFRIGMSGVVSEMEEEELSFVQYMEFVEPMDKVNNLLRCVFYYVVLQMM